MGSEMCIRDSINTGQTVGATNETGRNPGDTITKRPITTPDFMATLCTILGIDPHQELMASGDRPMPLVDKKAKVVTELIA